LKKAIVIGAGVVVAGLIFLVNPAASSLFPSCPLHTLTGLYCPGCGSTRAIHQLLHGHFATAFRFNPLLLCALPLIVAVVLWRHPVQVRPAWIWTLVTVVAVFGVLRNLPIQPFSLLSPQP
jgi:hypothetical protein